LVDLPQILDQRTAASLLRVLESVDEDEFAIREGAVYVRRLIRVEPAVVEEVSWAPGGAVLVTGGTGRIGSSVARWLAEQGAQRLVLLSRSGLNASGASELRDELRALGCRVGVFACDVSDRVALQHVWAQILADGPISAVFHTAAVLDDALISALTTEQVDRAMAVKVGGASNLHELAQETSVEKFVLFSSVGATLGFAGQGNYAPGNAYLDALAEYRRACGLAGTSIAWGVWAGGGMASVGVVRDGLQRLGVLELDPSTSLSGLELEIAEDAGNVVFARIDWGAFNRAIEADGNKALVSEIPEISFASRRRQSGTTNVEKTPAQVLATLSESERTSRISSIVSDSVKAILGHSHVDAQRSFKELGADSLSAVQLRNALRAATGLSISGTLIFDYPTPARLIEHLEQHFHLVDQREIRDADLDSLIDDLESLVRADASSMRGRVLDRLSIILAEARSVGDNGLLVNSAPPDEQILSSDDELFDFIDRRLS
ncbi:SDR family NAD(P)-dependent oxidoreductase, partial [Nocardia nova]|uniref:type I polyketide synthase n=1 Tax=Nocardia nova TaxID=37330 RepID=UPI001C48BA49